MSKGKHLLNANYCSMFSVLKYTDPHTIRSRLTLKDGIDNEHAFQNRLFRELKIENESKDLVEVLLESNQKSTELSVN